VSAPDGVVRTGSSGQASTRFRVAKLFITSPCLSAPPRSTRPCIGTVWSLSPCTCRSETGAAQVSGSGDQKAPATGA
jgi:hypothetical protein